MGEDETKYSILQQRIRRRFRLTKNKSTLSCKNEFLSQISKIAFQWIRERYLKTVDFSFLRNLRQI